MPEYVERCRKCYHFKVCANVMKNQLFIREKMLLEENPECEHFISDEDVAEAVHSKWMLYTDGSGECERCHMRQKNVWDYEGWQNFCGYCGAKMDGEIKG